MAEAYNAISFVLRQEDSRLSGVITQDRGGRTRFGIAERFHPELTASGFFDVMSHDDAVAAAVATYRHDYWLAIHGDQIISQHLANALLSFAIVEGTKQAVKLLQRTLGIEDDGIIGPTTIVYLNSITDAQEPVFMSEYRRHEDDYFAQVVAAHPDQAKFLHGWLNRAKVATA